MRRAKIFTMPIARDGFRFILLFGGLTILFFLLNLFIIGSLFGLLTLFIIYFFRDPDRDIPDQSEVILSPADGKIIKIAEVDDNDSTNQLNSKGICISIFLSIFNVHINRFPCTGRIIKKTYNPGIFLSAFKEKASLLNEQNTILIENEGIRIIVRQIAG
ncbi:MAG: phosphatidylserine decarboxylase, partial [Nitrospinae bacterium]|nr:phosphatidylserine decarboxylase [Nitrospinota bacterium]